jgi:hypothetical protein
MSVTTPDLDFESFGGSQTWGSITLTDPQVSDPQEADPPYQQELLYIRERHEACRSDEATAAYIYRRKQIHEQKAAEHAELLRKNTLRTIGLLYTGLAVGFAIVFIIIFTTLF